MSKKSDDLRQLTVALQGLAGHPQSQRRWTQLGLMRSCVEDLDRVGADLQPLVDAGRLDKQSADRIGALRVELQRALDDNEDFLEDSDTGSREFLYSSALENDAWEGIRKKARVAYDELIDEQSMYEAVLAAR